RLRSLVECSCVFLAGHRARSGGRRCAHVSPRRGSFHFSAYTHSFPDNGELHVRSLLLYLQHGSGLVDRRSKEPARPPGIPLCNRIRRESERNSRDLLRGSSVLDVRYLIRCASRWTLDESL